MNVDELLIREQFHLLSRFVYHVYFYWNLHPETELTSEHSSFWRYTIDAHLLEATLCWCGVFGSTSNNKTHWRNVAICGHRRESFRKRILAATEFTWEEWQNGYWEEMITFRNKYVAHWDRYEGNVPNFEKALAVARQYHNWLREVIAPEIIHEPRLEHWEDQAKIAVQSFLTDSLRKPK